MGLRGNSIEVRYNYPGVPQVPGEGLIYELRMRSASDPEITGFVRTTHKPLADAVIEAGASADNAEVVDATFRLGGDRDAVTFPDDLLDVTAGAFEWVASVHSADGALVDSCPDADLTAPFDGDSIPVFDPAA